MIKLYESNKKILSCFILGSCAISPYVHATAYNYPGVTAPLSLHTGDSLSVNSGVMQTTDNSAAFTVSMDANTTVTIESGATISCGSSGTGSASIYGIPTLLVGLTSTINNYGTISNGNALYAIYVNNVTGADDYIVNNYGAINGNVNITSVANAQVNFNGNATMLGNITFTVTGTSVINYGNTSPVNFTTQGTIANAQLINVNAGSTVNFTAPITGVSNGLFVYGTANLTNTIAGPGGIINFANFNIGANILLTDNFGTATTGVNTFTGISPNVLTTSLQTTNVFTSTYYTIGAIHQTVLNNLYNYGQANFIYAHPQFGSFVVAYTGGYFPEGSYTLVESPLIQTPPSSYTVPPPTLFLTFNTPTATATTININLTRTGFQNYATQGYTQQIAEILEIFGANSPDVSMLALLNAMERSQTPQQVQNSLQQLGAIMSGPMYSLMLQDQILEQVSLRIASRKHQKLYSSGDKNCGYTVWFRAIGDRANQNQIDDTLGYYATTGGGIGGIDYCLSPACLIGAALSVTRSTVDDKITIGSSTAVDNYEAMIYGSYDYVPCYTNWIVGIANTKYKANRNIDFNGYVQNAGSIYGNNQAAGKLTLGSNFRPNRIMQLTPEGSGLLVLTTGYRYNEGGGNATNLNVQADGAYLVQLAAGLKLEFPLMLKKTLFLPDLHIKGLCNVSSGTQNLLCSFIEGGTQFAMTANLPKYGVRYGAGITLFKVQRWDLKFNYDHTMMPKYTDNLFYLNFRYTF